MNKSNGFTLVEVIISIAVIAILATLSTIGIVKYQADARDSQRSTSTTVIAEALEKYYTQNGEYPSVRNVVNSYSGNTATSVSNLLGVNKDVLKMPLATSEQSLASTDASGTDVVIYDAESTVNNDSCQNSTTGGCDKYQLRYQTEAGDTVAIDSRYNGSKTATVAIAPEKPSLSLSDGDATFSILAESSNAGCSENAARLIAKYSFRYRVNAGTWTAWTTFGTSNSLTVDGTANQGKTYDFQTQARCDDGTVAGAVSPASDIESYAVPLNPPAKPTVTVAASGANALATVAVVTCPTGATTQYSFRSRTNNGTWGAYSDFTTTRTSSQAATAGVKYGYQAQARCYTTASTSAASTSTEATYTLALSAPDTPPISATTSGDTTTFPITAVTCPSNATTRYQYRNRTDYSATSAWAGPYSTKPTPSLTTKYQGYQYWIDVQAQCYNAYSTSAWSGTGTATYTRPVSAPGAPTNFTGSLLNRRQFQFTWTAPTCGTSASAYSGHNPYVNGSSNGTWYWTDTGASGYKGFSADGFYTSVYTLTQAAGSADIPVGGTTRLQVRYKCVNTATNRQSGYGPIGTSPMYGA